MNSALKYIQEAKMILATLAILLSSLTGAYYYASKLFVTTIYATELTTQYEKTIYQVRLQIKQNALMINEMRLIRLENKMQHKPLTPTELRVYEMLKKKQIN